MKFRTRVKICGVKNIGDARYVADLGADTIGLVFHQKSPRFIDLETAHDIKVSLPPFVSMTALLMDEGERWIARVIKETKPDCLQFHGSESVDACERWGLPYIKAISMGSINDAIGYAKAYSSAQGFLLDSNVAGRQGGTGDTFDWSTIPPSFDFPLVLAGGLNPRNVADAIAQVKPWAVDVSSGVEVLKGVKDRALIKQFFQEVKRGDAHA